jgi:rubrerythrin
MNRTDRDEATATAEQTSPEPHDTTRQASEAWWARIKQDPAALGAWLQDQYRGERTAEGRILALRDRYAVAGRSRAILSAIADQERAHADWVGELLRARGLPVAIVPKEERYWPRVLPGVTSLETAAAVGAHAERMRLGRIEAIAQDAEAPADIRAVFRKILPEERFHERAFRGLAGPVALALCQDAHELGQQALGLAP